MLGRFALLRLTLQQQPHRATAIAAASTGVLVRRTPCAPLCRSGTLCAASTQRWASSNSTSLNPKQGQGKLSSESNFETIQKKKFMYVDKTAYAKIANDDAFKGDHLRFIRPRRFGKSMLLTTLRAYYEGRKHLFAGLEAARLEETKPAKDRWAHHPVIYLDLGTVSGASVEEMNSGLYYKVERAARDHSLNICEGVTCVSAFEWLIQELGRKCKEEERPLPVVLIDEYHAPAEEISTFSDDAKKKEEMFTAYRDFFGVLKSQRRHLHAAFLTGILRAEIGGSSGANHVKDVTHHPALSGACGFTLEEIRAYCRPWLVEMAAKRCGAADSSTAGDVCWAGLTTEQQNAEVEKVVKEMQALYNGYHFSVDCETSCYNPFGLVRCFYDKEFGSNWARSFDSYSSEVIQSLSDAERQKVEQGVVCEKELLSATVLAEKSDANHVAALLQSGYLTIAKGVPDEVVLLRLPNGEVKHAFCRACYRAWKGISDHNAWKELSELHDALTNGDVRSIMAAIGRSFELGPQPSGQCGGEERALAAEEDSPVMDGGKIGFGGTSEWCLGP
eukprot:gene6590-biopygen4190